MMLKRKLSMIFVLVTIALQALTPSIGLASESANNSCYSVLTETTGKKNIIKSVATNFWKGTKQLAIEHVTAPTYVARPLVKVSKYDEYKTRYAGFFEQLAENSNWFSRKLSISLIDENGAPQKYVFSPFQGLYNVFVRKPVQIAAKPFFKQKMEPGYLIWLPVTILTFNALFGAYEHAADKSIQYYQTQFNQQEWTTAIKHQAMFDDLAPALKDKQVKIEDIIATALERKREVHKMTKEILEAKELSPHLEYSFTQNYSDLYSTTAAVLQTPLTLENYTPEQFDLSKAAINSTPGENADVVSALVNIKTEEILRHEIITKMVYTGDVKKFEKNTATHDITLTLENDPFTKGILALTAQHTISKDEAESYLTYDNQDKAWLATYKVLGITLLKQNADGSYTGQPASLSDNRNLTMQDIARRHPEAVLKTTHE